MMVGDKRKQIYRSSECWLFLHKKRLTKTLHTQSQTKGEEVRRDMWTIKYTLRCFHNYMTKNKTQLHKGNVVRCLK